MDGRVRRIASLVGLMVSLVAACAGTPASPLTGADTAAQRLPQLDLQVRNSGLHGGYLWLGSTNGGGRWHRLGQAELLCVTCPAPFEGSGSSYEVAVFDEACHLIGRVTPAGGSLRLVIDLGPTVAVGPAPPPTDWMPSDSAPIDATTVPCSPTAAAL